MTPRRSLSLERLAEGLFLERCDAFEDALDTAECLPVAGYKTLNEQHGLASLISLPFEGKGVFKRQLSAASTEATLSFSRCCSGESGLEEDHENVSGTPFDNSLFEGLPIAVARDGSARFVSPTASSVDGNSDDEMHESCSIDIGESDCGSIGDILEDDELIAVARDGRAHIVLRDMPDEDSVIAVDRDGTARFVPFSAHDDSDDGTRTAVGQEKFTRERENYLATLEDRPLVLVSPDGMSFHLERGAHIDWQEVARMDAAANWQ